MVCLRGLVMACTLMLARGGSAEECGGGAACPAEDCARPACSGDLGGGSGGSGDPGGSLAALLGRSFKRARLEPAPGDYDSLVSVSGSSKTYALLDSPRASARSFHNSRAPLCVCEAKQSRLVDLGPLRFPRYHSSLVCSTEPCWLEPYSCRDRTLKVWVLKLRQAGDAADTHAPLLPEPLRGLYVFEGLTLTVGCSCSL